MIAKQLFYKRFNKNVEYQWNNIKTILDWTTVIYGFLFVLLMFALLDGLRNEATIFIDQIPLAISLLFIYHLCWSGRIRVYVEEADEYFLLGNKRFIETIKKYSMIVSYTFNTIVTIFVITIFLFFTTGLFLTYESFSFYFVILLISYSALLIKKLWKRMFTGWNYKLSIVAIYILFYLLFILFYKEVYFSIILLGLFLYLINYYYKSNSFAVDVTENEEERMKYVRVMFQMSEYVPYSKPQQGDKKIIFFKSKGIYHERTEQNIINEMFLKYFIRNYRYIFTFLQLISLTVFAMAFLPLWFKYGLFFGFFFFIKEWLNTVYEEFVTHPFLTVFRKKLLEESIREKATQGYYYAACGLVGFILAISTLIHFS